MTDPPPASSTTLLIHTLSYDHYMVGLIFGCIDYRRSFLTIKQTLPIWDAPIFIAVTVEQILRFKDPLNLGFPFN